MKAGDSSAIDWVSCPNCSNPMTTHEVSLFYQTNPVTIDACASCNLLWFDHSESIGMTPQSVLEIFRFLGSSGMKPSMPLSDGAHCPRCTERLVLTHDMQRATRFTYWRCPSKHGELFTFCQFLLQKNFIRSPSAEDLARLKKEVRQISCSQCGGSIDLATEGACSHCGSAIAMIDPDGIVKAVRELNVQDSRSDAAIEAEMRAALVLAEHKAIFGKREAEPDGVQDLLDAGMSVLTKLLGR
jgi:hypothetical protein